jgi:hypothetical protein
MNREMLRYHCYLPFFKNVCLTIGFLLFDEPEEEFGLEESGLVLCELK